MALEDRCSPQSANSPPGVPQSPQSNTNSHFHHHHNVSSSSPCPTTSMLMLINNVIDSKSKLSAMDYETTAINHNNNHTGKEMSLLSSIASKNLFNIQNQFKFQTTPSSEKTNSPSRHSEVDEEEEEDDDEIDIENDTPKGAAHSEGDRKFLLPSPASPASSSRHSASPQISSPSSTTSTPSGNLKFSITQILSDNFGIESKFHQHAMATAAAAVAKFKSGQHPLQQYPFYPHHPAMAGMLPGHPHHPLSHHHHPHPSMLFRPYELDAELRNQQAAAAAAAAVAQQKMKNNFSSLFSSFQQQQQPMSNGASSRSSLEDFCDSKLSQLSSATNGRSGEHRPVISNGSVNGCGNSNSGKGHQSQQSLASPVSTASVSAASSVGKSARPDSGVDSSDDTKSETGSQKDENGQSSWPAWIYCTRYSDRPSSGPRYRRPKQPKDKSVPEDKRPRTAFSNEQLARLKREFNENRYLNERRRQELSGELGLNEAQIKIWFQNKRAKIKKTSGQKNPLAMQLMAQGLYNHSTVPLTKEEEELEMRMNGQLFD